jgi:hypothetical protein
MIIKIFENFTGSKIGKTRLLPFKVQSILDQIELYRLANGIYAVMVKDARIRCYLFLRYQEFYEGGSDDIRGRKFSIDEYIGWYKNYHKNKDMFTYAYDWFGFNIPSSSIEECFNNISDENEYDRIMKNIFFSSLMDNDSKDFYLLGIDSLESTLLDHEMAHGMYFTDPNYKKDIDDITNKLPKETYDSLKSVIINMGYNNIVVDDEIQAYMSTGLAEHMDVIPNADLYQPQYREVFDKYLKINKHPKEIKMDW